jgi:hypothetical protein
MAHEKQRTAGKLARPLLQLRHRHEDGVGGADRRELVALPNVDEERVAVPEPALRVQRSD